MENPEEEGIIISILSLASTWDQSNSPETEDSSGA